MQNRLQPTDSSRLAQELAALFALSVKHLKDRWRSLYGTEPPKRVSRELLTRAIAYRLQERAFGGLKPSTRRLLERIGGGRRIEPPRARRRARENRRRNRADP